MGRKDKPLNNGTDGIHAQMRQARQTKGISLTTLAARTDFTKGHLSSIENGNSTPSEELIRAYERELGLDEGTLMSLLEGTPTARSRRHNRATDAPKTLSPLIGSTLKRKDIVEAPGVRRLYGRRAELQQMRQSLIEDRCTLISILGIGGMGKTTLVAYLLDQIEKGSINHNFEYIAWYSLQDIPSLAHVIERFSNLFSDQQHAMKEEHPGIDTFIELFSSHRCLLVLDDFESILATNKSVGQYEDQYDNYGKLLQRVGESNHQSCLLLISREKPQEIPRMEGKTAPVRSMELSGMTQVEEVKSFLEGEKLSGTNEAWKELIYRYGGNPLAFKLISSTIREVFDGEIATFLAQGETTFGNLSTLLDEQIERLSDDERTIFYWLAVERGSVLIETLKRDVAPRISGPELTTKLFSLRQRFLIEYQGPKRITLQPAILSHATNLLIQQVCNEIEKKDPHLLSTHALIKAQAEDYVRNDQIRHILLPIRDYLVQLLGRDGAEQRLQDILGGLQNTLDITRKTGYTAGNILDLLVHLKDGDLSGFDFSHLTVQQSYLQRATLHNVDFSYSDLSSSVFMEPFKAVTSLALSSDGKLFAAGTITGEIWVWDTNEGTLKSVYRGDASWVCWSVTFSPDGQWLASGSEDQVVRIWDVEQGLLIQELTGHAGVVRSVAFSPDSKLLASGSEDRAVILWDISNIRIPKLWKTIEGHQGQIRAVAFNPYEDKMMLATGSDDGAIVLWNTQTGEQLWTLQEPSVYDEAIYTLAFSPNGRMLASGGKDCTVRIWDVDSGRLHRMLEGHSDWVWSVAFSHDSDTIASGSEDQSVRTWDVKTGELRHILSGHTGRVWAVAFHAKQDIFVSGGIDRSIRFWDVQRGVCLRILQGYMNGIRSIAYTLREKILACAGEDYIIYLWNATERVGSTDEHYTYKMLVGHTNVVWASAFHPDGQLLVTGGDDRTIRLWNVLTASQLDVRLEHDTWIRALAFRPDGEQFASGGEDGSIHLWTTRQRTSVARLMGHNMPVKTLAFHPNCTLLASGDEGGSVFLWNVETLQFIELNQHGHSKAHKQGIWSLAFNSDGNLLVSGSEDQLIRLWDVSSNSNIATLYGNSSWIGATAFHPTQRVLASGGGDNIVRLWDIDTGQICLTLRGHTGPISSITFITDDGNRLASGSHDGTVIIWDTRDGRTVHILQADRPYERMNISHVQGLNAAQIRMLQSLGAVTET